MTQEERALVTELLQAVSAVLAWQFTDETVRAMGFASGAYRAAYVRLKNANKRMENEITR